jgi:type IV pilus assembly protein PilQ
LDPAFYRCLSDSFGLVCFVRDARGANMRGAKSLVYAAALPGLALCAPAAWADGVSNHVRDVRVHAGTGAQGSAEVEILGSGAPTYNLRVADGGRRLLVDLADSDVQGAPAAITTPVGVIGGVLTQSYDTSGGHMARLTINLLHGANYRVVPDGATLKVVLTPSGAPLSGPAPASAGPADGSKAAGSDARAPAAPQTMVRDVRFERAPASAPGCAPYGCDRVVIDVGAIPPYSLAPTPEGHLRLELRATGLPAALARTLDVTAYAGALRAITASHEDSAGSTVLELDRATTDSGVVSVEGGSLIWSFPVPKPTSQPSPVAKIHLDGRASGKDGGSVRQTVTVAREPEVKGLPRIETSIHDEDPQIETASGGAAGFASTAGGSVLGQARYSGRRIDIDLKDADIHNVLRLLADTGHVNIVTADDVGGTITIRMRNVPWDQVLDVVLQAKGLGMVRSGNLIRVAPMAQLQKERDLKLAQQKQEYELTPLETRLIAISYAQADELQQRAKELLSPRGSIAVDERTNVLIARDIPANLNYIEELVRSLDTQTAQVLIEARIVEATSNYQRDVGIQWGGDLTMGPATGNATGVAFPSSVGVAGGNYDNNTPTAGLSPFTRNIATPNFAVNLPAAVGTGAGGALGVTLGSIDNTVNVGLRLSALETTGLVRIVSAPRVMVLDNREARINQGTLIPFSQVSALGVQTTFQEAKLQLLVRPHVTADGSVSMHVKLNRDEPNFNQTSPRGDPTILKREAETDLLVMDGHTAVIGGIYTRNTGRNLDQVPFFGDIPILGIIFQRRRASDARNELVIFITPHIVNRSEALGR